MNDQWYILDMNGFKLRVALGSLEEAIEEAKRYFFQNYDHRYQAFEEVDIHIVPASAVVRTIHAERKVESVMAVLGGET